MKFQFISVDYKMVKYLITFILMLAALHCNAQLVFAPLHIDESLSSSTKQHDFKFEFTNSGATSIKITSLETSCGCTLVALDKKEYLPSEKGELKGSFSTSSKIGQQSETITLNTDNLGQPSIKLSLKFNIKEALEIKPRLLLWRKDTPNSEKIVTIKIKEDEAVEILSATSKNEHFKAELVKPKEQKQDYQIKVTPKDTSVSINAIIDLKVRLANGEGKSYFIHAIIK